MSKKNQTTLRRVVPLTASLVLAFTTACASESLPLDGSSADDGDSSTTSSTGGGGLGRQKLPLKTIELITDDHWYIVDMAIVGDLDGDGYDDWVVHGGDDRIVSPPPGPFGAVHLFYGRESYPDVMHLADADFVIKAANAPIAALGDIDGDGFPDFGFPADCGTPHPFTGETECDETNTGIHLIYGGPERYSGEVFSNDVGVRWTIDVPDAILGHLIPVGDVNGDGRADMFINYSIQHITANSYSDIPGSGLLLFGRADRSEQAPEPGFVDATIAGSSDPMQILTARGVGDVDGDGYADVALSSKRELGICYTDLFYGGPQRFEGAMDLNDADASFDACNFEWNRGDLDTDGYSDFILSRGTGTPFYVVYGQSERFSGLTPVLDDFPPESTETRDTSLAMGDINGDSYVDLVTFQWYGDLGRDVALLVLAGGPDRSEGNWALPAEPIPEDELLLGLYEEAPFFWSGASGGDVNGDGFDDILLNEYSNDTNESRIYLMFGAPLD